MISQVSEKNMHFVRWLLAVGWLTLIFSLFYNPISHWFTNTSNTTNSLHRNPDSCVKFQGVCLPDQPYCMGTHIFWGMVIPLLIMSLLVFGHEFWRRICPLYFFSQIPRALGIQRKHKVANPDSGMIRYELVGVDKKSWLGRNYLYLQFGLLYLGLNIRILFVNSDRAALGLFLLLIIACAIAVGFLFKGKSWCQYFCPMAPVESFYTGTQGLLGSQAHLKPPQSITQSMCRTVDSSENEKSACVSCQSPCVDIDAERSYWEGITKPDQKLLFYGYFGLMFGFYFFYFLYSGDWNYYNSGSWIHEQGQLKSLFNPGFYIFNHPLPIPKLIAAPVTIAFCCAASYFICVSLEKTYRAYLQQQNKLLREEQILHTCFVLCTFASFNVFFIFSNYSIENWLPNSSILGANGFVVLVSSLWLYRSLGRSKDRYANESLASSLRRQLNKLAIDWAKFLEGRSLQDLQPEEVYVLTKILPSFSRADRLRVYKGVLQESLEEGNVSSADSLKALKNVRKELNVSDEEHYAVLAELGVEAPTLLDPQRQLNRENQLRIDGYRRSLELLIQPLVKTGTPLQEVFERQQKQIMALRQEYSITSAEQEQVLAEVFNQNGALLRTAQVLLAQLQNLTVRYQALQNSVPNPQAPVYVLLRQAVQDKQELTTTQLLSILEILGETPDAIEIARSTGILAANLLGEILQTNNEPSKWLTRLNVRVITSLRQGQEQITQPPTLSTRLGIVSANSFDPQSSNWSSLETRTLITEPLLRPDGIVEVLQQFLQDIDPLVQAASLYALHQLNPALGFQQARQLLDTKSNKDKLLLETAKRVVGKGQQHIHATAPTMIAQIRAVGRTERRVFQQPTISVGRQPENDIVICDNRISRQHAIFYLDQQGISVKDLGSSNGLRIGKELIHDQQTQLQQGDIVRFTNGDELVIFVHWEMQPQQGDTITQALGTLEKLLWLYQSSFLEGLKANALIDLARNSQVRVYRPEETICRIGTPADELIVLIDGEAKVYQNLVIKEGFSETIFPGQTIGELEVLSHTNYATTVVAAGANTRTLVINAQKFEASLAQNPSLARNLLAMVSTRLQESLGLTSSVTQI